MTGLVLTSLEATGSSFQSLLLLVGTPLLFGPQLAYRLRVAQPTLMDVLDSFDI